MTKLSKKYISLENHKEIFKKGKYGFEKEALRINKYDISKYDHPKSIGSKLCNKFITTDFSENQLELITPPLESKKGSITFLDDIGHFVSRNISDELMWPLSIPPNYLDEKAVKIADFGTSNIGMFKNLYRKGLANRYGKMMQSISGFHFNYSFSNEIWDIDHYTKSSSKKERLGRSEGYLKILRNITRMNWLLLYLTGASPVVSESMLTEKDNTLLKAGDGIYYLPYATSLRMSDLGYKNISRNIFQVSSNSFKEYIQDLLTATSSLNEDFSHIDYSNSSIESREQISPNILQIEDEYYAVARIKSGIVSDQRFIRRILNSGAEFIELRSLDLNPFSRVGIDLETVCFLECFFIHCFLGDDDLISRSESLEIAENDYIVSREGRKKNLMLKEKSRSIKMNDWGNIILDDISIIAEMLDNSSNVYADSVNRMRERLNFPDLTISAKILDTVTDEHKSYLDFGSDIAQSNKTHYQEQKKSHNKNWNIIKAEVERSLEEQSQLESDTQGSFDSFLDKYFDM
jgi:glutamate--cysteine ligase